ncbi:hypothetical protein [Bradyrhizobium prioriisuperbiae]|uniref:hypothetical protein n=1 Tax=Bradyrhizobium prioriisuperbiae TaxID=2854389 RepID=UPI0028F04472|nr:hypothetical protein [Bradyrhizobium prioritasuperba]
MAGDNEPPRLGNAHLTVMAFAILVAAIVALAFVTTLNRVDVKTAATDQPPGTTGLARPHPPLQRAPGEPTRESTSR